MTIRPIRFLLFCFSLILIISSCKKINEATDLGDDVIPGVDGVHTFDTTMFVETYNSLFDPLKDSVRVGRSFDHLLGHIRTDPFFGRTNAKIFLELKPEFYTWNFSGVYLTDSLEIDSVVLVLGWTGTYGDTMMKQRVNVYEMDQTDNFKLDSFYTLRDQYFTYSGVALGSKEFFPYQLDDSVYAFQDTTAGQLRIKLNNAFGQRLLDYDTSNAYSSDSAFNTKVEGFAIEAESMGDALMSFGLVNNANTKLAIYYHKTDALQTPTVSYFGFTGSSKRHNFINRDFSGTPLAAASATPGQDDLLYLINTPGSYATVKIPGLRDLSNRVINRAELIVEEVFDLSDLKFTVPQSLLLDVYDSSISDYKYTPYSFIIDRTSASPDPRYGLYGIHNTTDASGNPISVWKFDITRYVQNILTKQEPLHDFRLFTAQNVFERLRVSPETNAGDYTYFQTILNSQYAFGRVRVGGANHPTQRMRLRIIWTKI